MSRRAAHEATRVLVLAIIGLMLALIIVIVIVALIAISPWLGGAAVLFLLLAGLWLMIFIAERGRDKW